MNRWLVVAPLVLFCGCTGGPDGGADGAGAGGEGGAGARPGAEGAERAAGAEGSGRTAQEPGVVGRAEGLIRPEAVRYDPEQDVYFVANFGVQEEDPRDANGFISRVAPDGEVSTLRFIEGTAAQPLHMPRGMALVGDTLWVADVDGIHGFHRRTGEPLAFVDFTAHEPGFLNDVAPGPDGALYVTDTGLGRVYRIADGRAEVALEDERTGPPNGITWDGARGAFLLAPWGGGQVIRAWTPGSDELVDIATVPGGRFDGIELVDGRILVASQADSTLWLVEPDGGGAASADAPEAGAGMRVSGDARPLVRVPGAPADIGVDTRRRRVAVPYIALDRVDLYEIPAFRSARPDAR